MVYLHNMIEVHMVILLKLCLVMRVSSWFSCFKLLALQLCRMETSSFMTSAPDALVFVQVCNPVAGVRQGATGPERHPPCNSFPG